MTEDVRIAFRSLRRDAAFTAGVIATLALSIAGNASVFTVVRSVLLRPLPMTRPNELISIGIVRRDSPDYPFNIPTYLDVVARNRSLTEMSAYTAWNANLSGESDPERIPGVRITANYFRMVGVGAIAGRTLLPDEDTPGRQKVVVLTASLWQRRYGRDQGIVGRSIRLNGEPYTVVGVLPPEFAFAYNMAEFAVPLAPDADPTRNQRASISSLRLNARLKPGVSIRQAEADLDGIAAQMRREFPAENGAWSSTRVAPLSESLVAAARPTLLLLMSAVGLVLAIACANIAGLMLSRASSRQQEIAVRIALGAGKARLFRLFLAESAILSSTGALAGMVLANGAVPLLVSMSPASLPRVNEVRVDGVVLLVVSGIACGAAVLFSLVSALQASRVGENAGLRLESRNVTASGSQSRTRDFFVVAEIALALVLLVAAGLVMRSFANLRGVSPGFETAHLLTTRLSLPSTRYRSAADVMRFERQLQPALERLPGVQAAGAISILPLSGPVGSVDYTVVGQAPGAPGEEPSADYRMIDPGYCRAAGIAVLDGRNFDDSDRADSAFVVIVNAALAKQRWPSGRAVGAHVLLDDAGEPRSAEVVGVFSDVRATALDQAAAPAIFVPIAQAPASAARFLTNSMFWLVRTAGPPESLSDALRNAIQSVDPDVAAANRVGMEFYIARAMAERRFTLQLLLVFALSALMLSAQGIYALISHILAQQTREVGIRLALGAKPGEVARMLALYGLVVAVAGLVFGFAGCFVLSGLISGLLYNVKPWDPLTVGAVAAVLSATALMASLAPARRAMKIDPAAALRGE